MIEVIPFRAEHFNQIEVRREILQEEIGVGIHHRFTVIYEKYPSLTIKDGPKIVACFGGIYLWPNTAESWLRTSPDIRRYVKILYESINGITDFCFDMWNLNRVQTTIQKEWVVARRFAEHLGYVLEGELPYYIGDVTYLLYAKYKG